MPMKIGASTGAGAGAPQAVFVAFAWLKAAVRSAKPIRMFIMASSKKVRNIKNWGDLGMRDLTGDEPG